MSNRVRDAREDLKWSQERLAREAGVSLGTVQNCEKGQMPRVKTAQRLARALGSSVDDLFPEPEKVA